MNNNSGNILKNVHYETKDLKCNYYFFRIKDFNHIEKEHKTNSRKIKEHTPNILQLIKRNGDKLCSGVTKGYILDDLKDSDYILILTSINLPLHNLRDKDFVIDKLCGLGPFKNNSPPHWADPTCPQPLPGPARSTSFGLILGHVRATLKPICSTATLGMLL